MSNDEVRPRWVRDLTRFIPLKSHFVITGNVRDLQIRSDGHQAFAASLSDVLVDTLTQTGYHSIIRYDPVTGFTDLSPEHNPGESGDDAFSRLGLPSSGGATPGGIDLLGEVLVRHALADGPPIALIIDFASRLVVRSDNLSPSEQTLFSRGLVLAQSVQARPVGPNRAPRFNSVVWIAEREGDLPDWFTIDNPRLRHVPIATPDRAARSAIAPSLIRSLPGAREASADVLREAQEDLVDSTEGMLLMDLNAVTQLARSEQVPVDAIAEAVRRYKVGVTDDAWKKIERGKILEGAVRISKRVIGQDHAVTHMMDIVKRAATGIGGGRRGGRPRGVAFLAGPTGVGKTELAKSMTELLFGDESAYIRFDMSEFSAEHADQRLIGAPPRRLLTHQTAS